MKVQVGVISHKPGDLFERCMESLVRIPAGIDYELKLQLTEGSNAENWNRLMERCDAEFVCVLEDDTAALKPFWLKSLVQTMVDYPACGIVMPVETKDGKEADPGFIRWLNKTQAVEQTYGFCNLIRKKVGLKADENLKYFVDVDLSYQAMNKGWQCVCNGHVWMLHGSPEGRMSTDAEILKLQEKDHLYMVEKWGWDKAKDINTERDMPPEGVQLRR